MSEKQTLGFETEVKQLLKLVVHSLYSNKEIFLRELVSNASDALEKLRTITITQPELLENDSKLHIHVDLDKTARTITITDNGIGMNWQEVKDNLGTIARSGTKEFMQILDQQQLQDNKLIGQFGVGFYSAFIVADKVVVETRRAGESAEQGVRWESGGEGDYTIETITKPNRGTTITLHIRSEDDEFLESHRLRNIITKYSDHIEFPIMMKKTSFAPAETENNDAEVATEVIEDEIVNKATAMWTLAKSDIKDEDYISFYKHISHDFADPLKWTHNKVEGKQDFTMLLYIPKRAPFDLWQQNQKHGLKLYVKRVFIMDEADQFLPNYLRFVRGIIDSNDLPLNISREILQNNRLVAGIKQSCTKRVLGLLEQMAEQEPDIYAEFWHEFGQVLKEGIAEDFANKEQIAKLLRFSSTNTDEEKPSVTLQSYVSRMKEGQDKIYYITADSFAAAKNSPHLEIYRQKGLEVLLLQDRVDEWLVAHLHEFDGKSLHSVAKGALDLGKEENDALKEKVETLEKENKDLLTKVKEVLDGKVKEVRLTQRLTNSPACLIADEHDIGGQLKRILEAAGQDVSGFKPILELNPEHSLVKKLQDAPQDDTRFDELAVFLYEQSVLAEGGQLDDPAAFIKRVNHFILDHSL